MADLPREPTDTISFHPDTPSFTDIYCVRRDWQRSHLFMPAGFLEEAVF